MAKYDNDDGGDNEMEVSGCFLQMAKKIYY